jgi:hypothetical protein
VATRALLQDNLEGPDVCIVDGEKDRSSRVAQTDGQLHLLVWQEALEYEAGAGAAMEGGNPLPEDGTKAHVHQHTVQPFQRHTVIRMEEI